jgi:hypothetical protein
MRGDRSQVGWIPAPLESEPAIATTQRLRRLVAETASDQASRVVLFPTPAIGKGLESPFSRPLQALVSTVFICLTACCFCQHRAAASYPFASGAMRRQAAFANKMFTAWR